MMFARASDQEIMAARGAAWRARPGWGGAELAMEVGEVHVVGAAALDVLDVPRRLWHHARCWR
ncbi:hypothetical protein BE08_42830 [Sorangium cellulosum]|uniref:Uncharacterized protein n=1 Tax=Sorangium cellulosum TaxID=56 RepID=A0A150PIP8_SORCE|nr:hypothetical protein BE08_42830 [Sorangium cellulosum]